MNHGKIFLVLLLKIRYVDYRICWEIIFNLRVYLLFFLLGRFYFMGIRLSL